VCCSVLQCVAVEFVRAEFWWNDELALGEMNVNWKWLECKKWMWNERELNLTWAWEINGKWIHETGDTIITSAKLFGSLSLNSLVQHFSGDLGWVGYFSNKLRFSVQSSLQRIASNFWLWKRVEHWWFFIHNIMRHDLIIYNLLLLFVWHPPPVQFPLVCPCWHK